MRNRVNRQSMAIRESSKPDVPMRVTLGRHRSVVRLCPFKRRVFRLHQGTAILVPLAPSICLVFDRGHHFLDKQGPLYRTIYRSQNRSATTMANSMIVRIYFAINGPLYYGIKISVPWHSRKTWRFIFHGTLSEIGGTPILPGHLILAFG